MKKILFALVAVLLLASCSKDETNIIPTDGQYIADALDLVACMVIENGKCTYFAPFIQNEVISSWNNVSTSGGYPNYVYQVGELTITAKFESPTTFSALLKGCLRYGDLSGVGGGNGACFDGNIPINFKLDNRTLDANGDGILDSAQPDLFGK